MTTVEEMVRFCIPF